MKNMKFGFTPTHPGEVLKDEIEYRKISQSLLATQMEISYKILNDILNERRPITTVTALMFEAALDIPADSLMHLQLKYNMQLAQKDNKLLLRLAEIRKVKKVILLLLACFAFSLSLSAQKASLTKAYNLFYDKDFVKAKEAIDLCTEDEKLAQKAQTWLYKANIYFYLANEEYDAKRDNPAYQALFLNAAEDAFDAFVKAKEMNKNVEGFEMLSPNEGIPKIYALLLVHGVDELIAGNFEVAKRILGKAIVSYEFTNPPQFPLNGELYYYYAYTLEMLNDHENAASYYNRAIFDGSNNVNVYLRLIENYKKERNFAIIKEIIDAGKKALPDNPALFVAEIDHYYHIEEKETAHQLMEKLPTSVFENADLLVNIANFYILDNNYPKAYDLLKKANQITPNNFVIFYNLGVCAYYLSEENFQQANDLEIKGDKSNAMIYKTKSENYLLEAQTFFERVHQTEPKDLNVMLTLRSIYARLQSPKYEEMEAKIKAAEK
jgi:addiction module HigA family antidote